MANNLTYTINLKVNDAALKGLITALGTYNSSISHTNKGTAAVEKELAKLESSANKAAGGINNANKALAETTSKATSAARAAEDVEGQFAGIANTRYAMYDVATTLGVISAATLGLSIAAIRTAADYEALFASVQRTSQTVGSEWAALKESLVDLTTQIPVTAQDVAQIATLGGQLGIEAQNIDAFTESVAKFSATTDVSAQGAAEGLGRLAQLSGVGQSSFDELAASIYQVGVTSVATESAVLSVATQISVSARQAGFAADQTIALAGALASLGVAPERARGSIQRVFNILTNAADSGGARLETFARVSGVTAEEFAQTWKGDPQTAFQQFLAGLGRADKAGQNMNNILADVGISAVRDTDALKRLAQNTDVYAESIAQANDGWSDGSVFAEGYAVQTENLNAKMQVLGQTIQAIIAGSQNNALLKGFVDLLQAFASTLQSLSNNKAAQIFTGIAVAIGLLVGGLAALGAGAALASASILAMLTVVRQLTKEQGLGNTQFGLARLALVEYAAAMGRASQADIDKVLTATAATTSTQRLIATLKVFNATTRASSIALKGLLASTVLGVAFVGVGLALEKFTAQAEKAKQAKQNLDEAFKEALDTDVKTFQAAGGVFQEIPQAIDATGEASARAATKTEDLSKSVLGLSDVADTLPDSMAKTVMSSEEAAAKAQDLGSSMLGLKEATDTASGGIENQTQKVYDLTAAYGAAIDETIGKSLLDFILGEGDGQTQLSRLGLAQQALDSLGVSWEDFQLAIKTNDTQWLDNVEIWVDNWSKTTTDKNMAAQADALLAIIDQARLMGASLQDTAAGQDALSQAMKAFGLDADETADEMGAMKDAATNLADGLFDSANASIGMTNAMYALGQQVQQTGGGFDVLTQDGAANMSAFQNAVSAAAKLAGDDSDLFISLVDNIIQQMVAAGVTGVQQLIKVRNQYAAITGGQPTVISDLEAGVLMSNQLAQGMNDAAKNTKKVADNANKAQRAIRTLKDYVSDLSSVMRAAFDYRFGFSQAKDDTTSKIHDITEAFADARIKVRDLKQDILDLQATLSGLSADRNVLQYQLSVAQEYGDTLRATKILAELEKNASDTAKAQNDLSDKTTDLNAAQQEATATLTGNSDAAIEQRKNVEDLVQTMEDQIAAYAAQGHSQKEVAAYAKKLKGQLDAQLTAWGYNRKEVNKYTAALDDAVKIINSVPRNLTIKADANTSPAQKALDEFFAKNKDRTVNTTHNVTTNNKVKNDPVAQQVMEINSKIQALIAGLKAGKYNPNIVKYTQPQIDALVAKRKKLVGYSDGGYTGRGGKYEPKGVVHGNEYVVESERVNKLGVPFLNALGRSTERGYSGGGPVNVTTSFPGAIVVELSPVDRRLLAAAGAGDVILDGKVLAGAVNRANQADRRRSG